MTSERLALELCRGCGLCCDGALFSDVKLTEEDARRLSLHPELRPARRGRGFRLRQPCPAFRDGECSVYPERPQHCRAFECRLFQSVQQGGTSVERARAVVRSTRALWERVRRQFGRLGDTHERWAARPRFLRLMRRAEAEPAEPRRSLELSRLTLMFHRLNVRLRARFLDG